MTLITQPCETAVQLSTVDPELRPILSVLCKRTYNVLPRGDCVVADGQLPLVKDFQPDPDNSRRLDHDSDLYPWKLMTDIVVRGHAYGEEHRSFLATVQVEEEETVVEERSGPERRAVLGPAHARHFRLPLS